MRTKHYKLVGALAIALCSTVGLTGCGGDDDTNTPAGVGDGGGGGDAASEYCAAIDEMVDKIKAGDAAAAAEAATLGAKAAELTDPEQAAKAAECASKLAEAMTP